MRVATFAPAADLAALVRSLELVESDLEVERTLLPEPAAIVGFRYAGAAHLIDGASAVRMPDLSVTGLRTAPRRMRTAAGSGLVVAKLRETGAIALLGGPMARLAGRIVPLDTVRTPDELAPLAPALAVAATARDRIALVEAALRRWAAPGWTADELVAAAVAELRAARGSLRIAELARRLGASQDALERRFHRVVGVSPKAYASIVQLRAAVDDRHRIASLGQLAVHAGYYDQAHLNRRFRAMAGGSPGRALAGDELC